MLHKQQLERNYWRQQADAFQLTEWCATHTLEIKEQFYSWYCMSFYQWSPEPF